MFWHWVPRYMVGYVELMITKKRAGQLLKLMEVRTDTGMWSVPVLVLSDVREEYGDMIMQKKMGEGLSMLGNGVEEWWPCDNYRAFKSIQGF